MSDKILIIEDNLELSQLMRLQLAHAGYEVAVCHDGLSGLEKAAAWQPDLVLLDVLMPQMDGWTVSQRLMEMSNAPVLFTTALGSSQDFAHGMELGADDYIIKPFTRRELVSRVQAALYRARRHTVVPSIVQTGRLRMNLETREVLVDGHAVELTPLEFELLSALARNIGRVVSHTDLLRQVWGPESEERREYLKLYVWYLRRKIEQDPTRPEIILSERGVGYRLAES